MAAPLTIVIEGNDQDGWRGWTPDRDGLSVTGRTADDTETAVRKVLSRSGERVGVVQIEATASA